MEGMIRPPSNLTIDTQMKFDYTHIDAAVAARGGVTAYITERMEILQRVREAYAEFEWRQQTGSKG